MIAQEQSANLVYAGFWVRVWASIIDTVLVCLITLPLLISLYGTAYLASVEIVQGPMDFLISYILPAIAVIVFWIYKSATPGKMAISAQIVDAQTGGRPSNGQFIGRYLAYFVSIIPLCLGILWVAFDKRKQGWHDKLAGTVVVIRRSSGAEHVLFSQSP